MASLLVWSTLYHRYGPAGNCFNTERPRKIKNEKIQRKRFELRNYNYELFINQVRIIYLLIDSPVCEAILHKEKTYDLLCHSGLTMLAHFVKVMNLP